MNRLEMFALAVTVAIAATATGCGKKEAPQQAPPVAEIPASPATVQKAASALPPLIITPTNDLPAAFKDVLGQRVSSASMVFIPEIAGKFETGHRVVIEAKVMGAPVPFNPDRAEFLVGDELTVASCDLLGIDERCPTPWDVHHEDPVAVKAGTAWIRIVDGDGRTVARSLRGMAGLRELSRVRVAGTLVSAVPGEPVVINATAIQLEP